MNQQTWLVFAAVALFGLFVALKAWKPRLRRSRTTDGETGKALESARRRIRAAPNLDERALAFQEAARAALASQRTRLAAVYALRAERARPMDKESQNLVTSTLKRASRYRALERFLWKKLADNPDSEAGHWLEELAELYQGPLRQPVRAQALRRLSAMTPPVQG